MAANHDREQFLLLLFFSVLSLFPGIMSFTLDLHSLVSKYMPTRGRRERETPDTDSAGIPFSNRDDIDALRRDYEEKTRSAQDPTLESCFKCVTYRVSTCRVRLIWHSPPLLATLLAHFRRSSIDVFIRPAQILLGAGTL